MNGSSKSSGGRFPWGGTPPHPRAPPGKMGRAARLPAALRVSAPALEVLVHVLELFLPHRELLGVRSQALEIYRQFYLAPLLQAQGLLQLPHLTFQGLHLQRGAAL